MYQFSEKRPKRYTVDTRPTLRQPLHAFEQFEGMFLDGRECFVMLMLDTRYRVIDSPYVVSVGSLNASLIHPRELFREAIVRRAAAIIVAHNHPSGCLDASEDDIELTKRIDKAGTLLGIAVLDHLIVGNDDFTSMREASQFA